MSTTEAVTPEKIDVEALLNGLNGFDEIAITQKFGTDLASLSQTMTLRAVLFIRARRNGRKDQEAYREAMQATLGELQALFADPTGEEDATEGEG